MTNIYSCQELAIPDIHAWGALISLKKKIFAMFMLKWAKP